MEGKFIVFVVFASLAQCSFASLPLNITYGLPDNKVSDLDQIIINQDETLEGFFGGFNPVFDIIEKYAAALVYNLEVASADDSATVAAALASVKGGIDYVLDVIPIATGKSDSSAIEEFRSSSHASFDNAYAVASSALALASSGDFSANQAQLEVYRDTIRDELKSIVSGLYDLIRTVSGTSDEQVLASLEVAQDDSERSSTNVAYAFTNAINVYSAALTAGEANVSLIAEIESYRENGLDGLTSKTANIYTALRTLFIYSELNESGLLPGLAANQFSLIVGFNRLEATIENYFATIASYVEKVALGLQDSGRSDFSPEDASAARASAKVTAAYEVLLDSVLVAQPDAVSTVAEARVSLATVCDAIVEGIYEIIDTAANSSISYSETLSEIETARESATPNIDTFVTAYFDAIRNGNTWDSDSETEFNTFYAEANEHLQGTVDNIFDAVETLAKVVAANEAGESDFSAVSAANARGDSTLDLYTQKVSAAGVVQLKAVN